MGRNIYESLDELLNQTVLHVTEDADNYYVKLKTDDFYDNIIWVCNKRTGKVSWMLLTEYFVFEDDTKPVNPDELKESLK